MIVYGLDPGPEQSALVGLSNGLVLDHRTVPNDELLASLKLLQASVGGVLVIEQIASFGMAVGAEVFETCFWSGRFAEAWNVVPPGFRRLKRMDVKMHLCKSSRAKDANIRQALLDRFGPQGTKKNPGKLYGIKGDEWSALAVAVTWSDLHSGDLER